MTFRSYIHMIQTHAFSIVSYIILALYVFIALGLSSSAPKYLDIIQYYLKIYIGLFLIFRFNPFRSVSFTPLDKKIAFDAGLFLLVSMLVGTSEYNPRHEFLQL